VYVGSTKTVTIRDFRTRPRQVRDALTREREAVLTANGRPVALLIAVDAASMDETIDTLKRARGLEALHAVRAEARRRGLAGMRAKDIDAIITKTRNARTRRRKR